MGKILEHQNIYAVGKATLDSSFGNIVMLLGFECDIKVRDGLCHDLCISGLVLDVLEHGFKELMPRAFACFT